MESVSLRLYSDAYPCLTRARVPYASEYKRRDTDSIGTNIRVSYPCHRWTLGGHHDILIYIIRETDSIGTFKCHDNITMLTARQVLYPIKPMIHGPTCRKQHVGYDKI